MSRHTVSADEAHESTRNVRPDPLIGRVLGERFAIERLIGEGGMGRVYLGHQLTLGRRVAIKCIHPHLVATEQAVARFMEEARVASGLVHPNVVRIYDFGRAELGPEPTFFLAMELLTGPDLGTVLTREAPLPTARIRSILLQVLSALEEAHARGVTHRDAKPDNVILEPASTGERVKIIDFGVAKVHGGRGITGVGQFVGTPHYMPPEQIRGEAAHVSSDLYAVGVTLFQMLTGRLPFTGENVTAVLEQQLYARRPDPRDFAPCEDAVAEVCLRALHVEAAQRFLSADAFAEALDAAARTAPSLRPRSGVPASGLPRSAPPEPSRSSAPPTLSARSQSSAPPRPARLAVGEAIERTVRGHLAAGRLVEAERELRRGMAFGFDALEGGHPLVGKSALSVFGRMLGSVVRDLGRLDEAEQLLVASLDYAAGDDVGRARILTELAIALAQLGRAGEAEGCRLEALRLAAAGRDKALIERLRRLAQSLSVAGSRRGRLPSHPAPSAASPPPRQSEWRFRAEQADPEDAPVRRQR